MSGGTGGSALGGTGAGGAMSGGIGGSASGGHGAGGAGTAGAAGTGTGGVAPTGCGSRILADSPNRLIDLFVSNAGIIVVDASGVTLLGRDGSVLKNVPFSRQITAAAFDGTTLVVADAAELTLMSPTLDVGPTGFLTVTCTAAVLVGGDHFVCGSSLGAEQVFYTYGIGVNPPVLIATSATYGYTGTPMARVPGTSSYVTVDPNISPPSFYLFEVADDTGQVTGEGASPFDAYAANQIFAFDGTPATHLIQTQGDILNLTGPGCIGSQTSTYSCFMQSGVLGTLRSGEGYIGLGDDGAGHLAALVNPSILSFNPSASPCANGCPVQIVDLASRTISQQTSTTISDFASAVRTTLDAACGDVIIGYTKLGMNGVGTSGYRVQSIGFGQSVPDAGTSANPDGGIDSGVGGMVSGGSGGSDSGTGTGDAAADATVGMGDAAGGGGVGGGGDAGTAGASGSGGSGGSGGVAACGTRTLIDSSDTLINMFVVDDGVIVVNTSSVTLFGRDASIVKTVPFLRQITAAAFDGSTLVVADEAELTVMSPALDVDSSAFLTESCGSAVLLGEKRFVCGAATDQQRHYYVYDVGVDPPNPIAVSMLSYTYDGIPMTRVPGTDSFVTFASVGDGYELFQVDDTGQTSHVGETGFGTDASQTFAFDGTPATRLIDTSGNMLAVTGPGCAIANSASCFTQDGVLGTVQAGQFYIGLGDNGAGEVAAVVNQPGGSNTNSNPFGSPCSNGCLVQIIDIASRTVKQQATYPATDLSAVVRMTVDSACGDVIVGYSKLAGNGFGPPFSSGYRVDAVGF